MNRGSGPTCGFCSRPLSKTTENVALPRCNRTAIETTSPGRHRAAEEGAGVVGKKS